MFNKQMVLYHPDEGSVPVDAIKKYFYEGELDKEVVISKKETTTRHVIIFWTNYSI